MELSEIEDRLKIHDLFARYMRAVDTWNETELLACFTEDGALETPILGGRFAGREGQRQFVANGRKNGQDRQSRHLFTNLEVELDGEHAHARAYLAVTSTRDGKTAIFATGSYDCGSARLMADGSFPSGRYSLTVSHNALCSVQPPQAYPY